MKTQKEIESIDRSIASAVASVEMEGYEISEEAKSLVRKYALGEITLQDYFDWINEKYGTNIKEK